MSFSISNRTVLSLACGLILAGPANADEAEEEPQQVSLQLKWYHQFQFAGYYAADIKGYFLEEGLDVELRAGDPEFSPIEAVLSGNADFGVSDSDILLARMRGEPVVACATIFQHSPYVLLTRNDSGIRKPSDLLDRRVLVSNNQGSAQFQAMMKREGLPVERISLVSSPWSLDDLVAGRVDAVSAHSTADYSQLESRGVDPYMILPSDYGVDFYGDTLFTTETFVNDREKATEAMIRATSRGWAYAMKNPEEMIDYILGLPGVKERGIRRENLVFEAQRMRPLILPDVVELGHMNPGRWQRIAETYVNAGIADLGEDLDWLNGFIYESRDESLNLRFLGVVYSAVALTGLLAFVWTLVLRRQVEERTQEVRKSYELKQGILESAIDAVIGVDGRGRIVHWNAQAERVFGVSKDQAEGSPLEKFLPDLEDRYDSESADTTSWRFEIEARRADGSTFPAELSMSRIASNKQVSLNIFARDITGQKSMEETLRQSQKMQAIGQLAGGVAHDFNNLLTVIQGNASIAKHTACDENRARLSEILAASERAAGLTNQLLAFSRQQPMQLKAVHVNDAASGVCLMLTRLIGEDIRLVTDFCHEPTLVQADPGMLEQILINLAVNARDAMPQGGLLTISTRIVTLGEHDTELWPDAVPGEFVRVQIRDTGTGIPEDQLPHIFEPFFTTKDVGKGTGLGLATVFGIVQQHKGWMHVESTFGEETVFSVWLPLSRATAKSIPSDSTVFDRGGLHAGSNETILLVEDEKMVRMIARKLLDMHGYRVLEAESGRDALKVWAEHSDEIDLLLTDIVMPEGLSGHDLAQKLQLESPGLKVIYSSGYSAEIFRGDAVFPDDALFLGKPYQPDDLLGKVREAFGAVVLPA
ncbi:MAG: ABC transporter substrate-binding protein [Verrucomicrobiales bacterium]